jgi:hypothetical protein
MKLSQRYNNLNLWNKVAFWGSICSILGLLYLFLPNGSQSKAAIKVTHSAGAAVLTAVDSPNAVQIGTLNISQLQQKDSRPLKDKIRAYLHIVNPKIIELLDSGQPSVAVMINTVNQPSLFELQKEPDFGDYLEVQSMGSVASGAHNTIGGHLNDLQDVGMLNGFEFVFKDKLKLK